MGIGSFAGVTSTFGALGWTAVSVPVTAALSAGCSGTLPLGLLERSIVYERSGAPSEPLPPADGEASLPR